MRDKIVSVVTPSLNQGKYIGDTIESILKQEGDNIYIDYIIIDGNSRDNSKSIIKKYNDMLVSNCSVMELEGLSFYTSRDKSYPYCRCKGISYRWTSEPDTGHGNALNKGFAKSIGNIMAWLNSDDMYHPGALQTVYEIFSDHQQIKWLMGVYSWWNEKGECWRQERVHKNIYDFILGNYSFIQQESTFWRRELWDKAGGHISEDYKYIVDGELWSRFFLHEQIFHVDKVLSGFRTHQTNRGNNNLEELIAEMESMLSTYRKNLNLPFDINYKEVNLLGGKWTECERDYYSISKLKNQIKTKNKIIANLKDKLRKQRCNENV